MLEFQFKRALLHAKFDLDRFQLSLKRLDAQDFPSGSAKDRIRYLTKQLKDAKAKLDAIESDFLEDPQGASDRLVSEYRKLVQNRQQLEVLDRARSDEVPWSLVPSIEKLSKQLLPGWELLITTTPEMNYMVGWSPAMSHPFVTIYLPGLHRANAFLHILIGHELFHPIVEPFIQSEQSNIDASVRDECKKLLGTSDQPLFDQHRLDQVVLFTLEAWRKGLTELMCDMGAVALFGPSALWTISSFAATRELDLEPTSATQLYPPWRLRIRTIIEYLKEMEDVKTHLDELMKNLQSSSHDSHARALAKGFEDEESLASSLIKDPTNPLIKLAYISISKSLARAKVEVKRLSNAFSGKWTTCTDEIPDLIGRLKLLVPPCEIIMPGKHLSKPASFAAILMACWIERLARESDGLNLQKYREICRLTLKAIEDADLKSDFLKWKATT